MKTIRLRLLIFALFMIAASTAFADPVYNVQLDTSTLNGSAGYLYFQYVPANGANSTAIVTNLLGGSLATLPSPNVVDGSAVTGALPGPVTFANTNGINDYNHGITFADSLRFFLSFTGPASGGIPGGSSTFSLGLFQDEFGSNPLLGGTQFTADLMNDGAVYTAVSSSFASVNQVPEPGSLWLLAPGLFGLLAFRRRTER